MSTRKPIGTTARTGENCPESGVWKPNGYSTTAPIAKGNRMPPYDGKAVTWTLDPARLRSWDVKGEGERPLRWALSHLDLRLHGRGGPSYPRVKLSLDNQFAIIKLLGVIDNIHGSKQASET